MHKVSKVIFQLNQITFKIEPSITSSENNITESRQEDHYYVAGKDYDQEWSPEEWYY